MSDKKRSPVVFFLIAILVLWVLGKAGSSSSDPTSSPGTTTTSAPITPDTQYRVKRHVAESLVAATPTTAWAKLPYDSLNALTNLVPITDSNPGVKALWTAYRKQQSKHLAEEAKAEVAARIDRVIGMASCKLSKARAQTLLTRHIDWDNDVIATVGCRKVRIGMTSEQVAAAWGRRDDINTTTGSFGVHEQWVWEDADGMAYQYAYMEDGILTTIQD